MSEMMLKLLIDKNNHNVLFAEADKDFIDFLFYLFSLPIGKLVELIGQQSMVGCIGDLHHSLKTLDRKYMQPNQSRNAALNPKSPGYATGLTLLLCDDHETRSVYSCTSSGHCYVSDVFNSICPTCKTKMTRQLYYVTTPPMAAAAAAAAKEEAVVEGGFVKGVLTYLVMDNLEVMPMSTISSIALLSKCNVTGFGALEERIVYLGKDEALKLLKASLGSKTALTDVFLGNAGVKRSRTT